MHCADPGCLAACPAPGAIVQYTNGIVDFQQDQCIGCGYCITGCPFDVPKIHTRTKRVYKCTLCVDRVAVGLQPACVKACPTSCLQFGTKDAMLDIATKRVAQLQANGFPNAAVYDPPGVGGTSVVTVLDARRPARAVRPAARSVGAARGEALEGTAQVDREPGDARGSARSVRSLRTVRAERPGGDGEDGGNGSQKRSNEANGENGEYIGFSKHESSSLPPLSPLLRF